MSTTHTRQIYALKDSHNKLINFKILIIGQSPLTSLIYDTTITQGSHVTLQNIITLDTVRYYDLIIIINQNNKLFSQIHGIIPYICVINATIFTHIPPDITPCPQQITTINNPIYDHIIAGVVATQVIKISTNMSINKHITIDTHIPHITSRCCIIGCGSIGSHVVNILGSTNVQHIHVVDPKIVSQENIETHTFNATGYLKVHSFNHKVIPYPHSIENKYIFNKKFYDSVDVVIGCVDNVRVREHIARMCMLYKKRYIDCGSDGFMGHVQSVVPYVTETYDNIRDMNEPSVQLCNITSYHLTFDHCIMWAQSKLSYMEKCVNVYKNGHYSEGGQNNIDNGQEYLNFVLNNMAHTEDDCSNFAHKMFWETFYVDIMDLLEKFPENHILNDGTLFWKDKKCPQLTVFDPNSEMFSNYILYCGNIWASLMGLKKHDENDKDKYVYYASSLRAIFYGIDCVDEFTYIGIKYDVVPRLIGTSMIVAGFACLEIEKTNGHKNTFISVDEIIQSEPGVCNKFSVWDTFIIERMKLKDFLKHFKNNYDIDVTTIVCSCSVVFSCMLSDDVIIKRMNMDIADIVGDCDGLNELCLQICDDGDDDLPEVIYIL